MMMPNGKKRAMHFLSDPSPDDSQKQVAHTEVSLSASKCWKCHGHGKKYQKSTKSFSGETCKVCHGQGVRPASKKSLQLASQPGKIQTLRGYPVNHPLRMYAFPDGFAGPRAVWGQRKIPDYLQPRKGELVASLGCGDWRIYQIQNGNKLTVDDFVCALVAAQEMRKRGWGIESNPVLNDLSGEVTDKNEQRRDVNSMMYGGKPVESARNERNDQDASSYFKHADLGTGCGSVLMMVAWAFLGQIRSVGVEAQDVSFHCLQRGVEWNLGTDGSHADDLVRIQQGDLRSWKGDTVLSPPYDLITGTPPYFPLDSFVASQNHDQKVRCRVPTRGSASDYIRAASRLLKSEEKNDVIKVNGGVSSFEGGVFCMVEAAFDKAEAAVLDTVKQCGMRIERRVDVVTREGLPPRFSCWVMTKPAEQVSTDKKVDGSFPIETLTLRNADLSRSHGYSRAMELMGWVDFEKTKKASCCEIFRDEVAQGGSDGTGLAE